jgi:hypothetical protein
MQDKNDKGKGEKKEEPLSDNKLTELSSKAAAEAARSVRPKATWLAVEKVELGEGKDKQTAYEFDGRNGKEREMTVVVTAAGKVVEIDTLLESGDVPREAVDAVKAVKPKAWAEFQVAEAHDIRLGDDLAKAVDEHVYDLRGSVGNERAFHAQVSAKKVKGKVEYTVTEYTVQIPAGKVDERVSKEAMAALAKRKKFEYEVAYELVEGGKVIGYHFDGKGPNDLPKTLFVSADGAQLHVVGDQ